MWSNDNVIIPLFDVSHIERVISARLKGVRIITDKTKWSFEHDCYENAPYLFGKEAEQFIEDWCKFRAEIDPVRTSNPEQWPLPAPPEAPPDRIIKEGGKVRREMPPK